MNYSVGAGALLAQSGDFISCENFEGKAKYRIFQSDPRTLETIAEEIGKRFGGGRIFQSPFICDESLGRLILRFYNEMEAAS